MVVYSGLPTDSSVFIADARWDCAAWPALGMASIDAINAIGTWKKMPDNTFRVVSDSESEFGDPPEDI